MVVGLLVGWVLGVGFTSVVLWRGGGLGLVRWGGVSTGSDEGVW